VPKGKGKFSEAFSKYWVLLSGKYWVLLSGTLVFSKPIDQHRHRPKKKKLKLRINIFSQKSEIYRKRSFCRFFNLVNQNPKGNREPAHIIFAFFIRKNFELHGIFFPCPLAQSAVRGWSKVKRNHK
jgi:hypothetical protein